MRWQLTPRVSVGPEFVFMRGPDDDRDVFLTGKVIVDFMPGRLVSPYFVADGGAMLHGNRFSGGPYWVAARARSASAEGARIDVTLAASRSLPSSASAGNRTCASVSGVTWRP